MTALVLIGPMGAGKTSIGRRVAKSLGVPFTDTDAAIVREHGPIERIFAEHGEAHFRSLERDAVLAALENGGVVALGGGAVLEPVTRVALLEHRVVLLTVGGDTIASRLRATTRPLLQGEDPVARWHAIYESRRPLYEQTADVVFDTSAGPLRDVVDAVARWADTTAATEEHA
ncbi:AAA family ATPase [Microbacterium sp. zg.Y1090]|uniref:shikimate kinase n=1 Tax=Microbacterium TaxID=33882 RepID=UPI00214B8568|nr:MULTISPECIES: shikimate kinase [unclassified Microbacterium]MCR2811891.1 AAA family ATPase [Microbacterium sp. zg.Y1084]MCR2818670.1 AAA family ATPase [Microbacterium sp. zg.Y1090]MDL5486483.1 shikimate kinase [Microbacterium sp. zg-Y1211]WIM29667.1 shikimate kinase [Microbacterium sp. zg-Y1090]